MLTVITPVQDMEGWQVCKHTHGELGLTAAAGQHMMLAAPNACDGHQQTAQAMADDASKQARADLASTVCVSKFMKSPDAAATLATLKETQSWKRDDIIKEGGWATMIGIDKPSSDTIDMCADKLAEMEMPATAETGTTEAGTAGG